MPRNESAESGVRQSKPVACPVVVSGAKAVGASQVGSHEQTREKFGTVVRHLRVSRSIGGILRPLRGHVRKEGRRRRGFHLLCVKVGR